MSRNGFLRLTLGAILALTTALGSVSTASVSTERARIRVIDDCDPATFDAAIGPGTCVGDGETTFQDFLAQLTEEGTADGWAFRPRRTAIDSRRLVAVNRGGEFHTFTEVKRFGGGCIEFLNNLLGLTPVPECQPEFAPGVPLAFVTTGVDPGARLRIGHLTPGAHRFLCLIHPWMRSTVRVQGEDD